MVESILRLFAFGSNEWVFFKRLLEQSLDVSHDALHVIAGVAAQLAVAFATRSSVSRLRPWIVVFGIEIINEYNDLRVDQWPDAAVQFGEGAKDLFLTMLLPTVLLVLSRRRPALFARLGRTEVAKEHIPPDRAP